MIEVVQFQEAAPDQLVDHSIKGKELWVSIIFMFAKSCHLDPKRSLKATARLLSSPIQYSGPTSPPLQSPL